MAIRRKRRVNAIEKEKESDIGERKGGRANEEVGGGGEGGARRDAGERDRRPCGWYKAS